MTRWAGLFVLAVLAVLAGGGAVHAVEQERAVRDGVLDARDWTPAQGPLDLRGAWAFFWGEALSPPEVRARRAEARTFRMPGMWNGRVVEGRELGGAGLATFAVTLLLPAEADGLGLAVPEIKSAYRLYMNGRRAAGWGVPAAAAADEVADRHREIVTLPAAEERVELVLVVSNHAHFEGGVGRPFVLGIAQEMRQAERWSHAVAFLMTGAALFVALYVLMVGLRRPDAEYLLFAACAVTATVRMASAAHLPQFMFPGLAGEYVQLGEYLAAFLFPGLYLFFLQCLFPREMVPWLNKVIMAVGAAAAVFALFAPPIVFTRLRDPFVIVNIATIVYAVVTVSAAAWRRREGAVCVGLSALILGTAVLNDALHVARFIDSTSLLPVGFAAFILGHAVVLGTRLRHAFDDVHRMSQHLTALNRGLERRVTQATRSLREGRDRLRAILANVPDAVVTVDEDGKVETFAPSAERLFGWQAHEVVGRPATTLVTADWGTKFDAALARRRKSGKPVRTGRGEIEVAGVRKDGTVFPMAVALNGTRLDGRLVFVATGRDVTERHRHEQEHRARQQQAKEQAEQAARMKSEFLATMSHEIRTPMNGIMGMVQMLLTTPLDRQQKDYVETVSYACAALLTILNDILDFEKLEAGRLELEHTPFDLRRLVCSATDLLTPRATAKGLSVEKNFGGDLPETVVGDPTRLRQVFLNLLSNAVKFTDAGKVSVSVGTVARRAGEVWLRFEVRDTGIGLSAEVRETLFTRFTQGDPSTAREYGGSGLGLAICRRIVDLMGGELGVESEVGAGSVFWFDVPFTVEETPDAVPSAEDADDIQPLNVLLVEDVAVNRKVATAFLARDGHTVAVAETGEAAVDVAAREDFDLILMDIRLPGIDGIEAARRIRGQADTVRAETPIVALTANVFPEDVKKYRAAGINGVLPKPIQGERMRQVLLAVLAGRDAWTEAVGAEVEAPASTRGTLDLPFLEERARTLDTATFRALLRLNRRNLEEAVARVDAVRADPAADTLAGALMDAGHKLAGVAANFGFAALLRIGREMEGRAEAGDMAGALQAAAQAAPVHGETMAELDAWLASAVIPGWEETPYV